jgi:hypothetical protein
MRFETSYKNGDAVAYFHDSENKIVVPIIMPDSYKDDAEVNAKRIEQAQKAALRNWIEKAFKEGILTPEEAEWCRKQHA